MRCSEVLSAFLQINFYEVLKSADINMDSYPVGHPKHPFSQPNQHMGAQGSSSGMDSSSFFMGDASSSAGSMTSAPSHVDLLLDFEPEGMTGRRNLQNHCPHIPWPGDGDDDDDDDNDGTGTHQRVPPSQLHVLVLGNFFDLPPLFFSHFPLSP